MLPLYKVVSVTMTLIVSTMVSLPQQETASTKMVSPKFQSLLLSLSKLMDVKTSLGSRPVAHLLVSFNHWLARDDAGWAASLAPQQTD